MEVDVAVVGGGPSGAATAYYLATRGHSVLLCEKKRFPREKTCGDGLTPRAVKILQDMGLGGELGAWEAVRGLRLHRGGTSLEIPFPSLEAWCNYGLVKARKDLDRLVLDHAKRAGAGVLHGAQVIEPLIVDGTVRGIAAQHEGERCEVRAHWVVCAEGAASKLARALGRVRAARYPMGFAIRQYFSSPQHRSGWFEIFLDVRGGRHLIPGYGWIFPMGDGTVNGGVGVLNSARGWAGLNLHRLQEAFLANLAPEWQVDADGACTRPRAGRLFMGGSVWPPHGPGFLLAGDAAGAINPCSGEGIAYGYETGRIAADHIDQALRRGESPSLNGYTAELEETYSAYYRLGRGFARLIAHPRVWETVVSMAMQSRSLMSFFVTVLVNLEDSRRSDPQQRGFRLLKRLAELTS